MPEYDANPTMVVELDPARGDDVDRAVVVGTALQARRAAGIVGDVTATLDAFDPDGLLLHGRRGRLFVAEGVDGDLGRCLAIAPQVPPAPGQPATGYVACWECAADIAAQVELFTRACEWLEDAGCTHVHGPMSVEFASRAGFSPASESALELMVDPSVWNGRDAWIRAGAAARESSTTWCMDLPCRPRLETVTGYHLRTVNLAHLDHAVADMRMLLRAATREQLSWPSAADALAATVERVERLIDPNLIIFAIAASGELAGFACSVPDHSDVIRTLDGDWSAAIAGRRLRTPEAALVHSIVVHPDHPVAALTQSLLSATARNARLAGYAQLRVLGVPDDAPLATVLHAMDATPHTRMQGFSKRLGVTEDPAATVHDVAQRLQDYLTR